MNVDRKRRQLLRYGAGGALGALLAGPWLRALAVDAPGYPAEAFSRKDLASALAAIAKSSPIDSDKITFTAPEIAENGAVVPVTVETTLPNVTRISLVATKNPFPLTASFLIPEGTEPYVSNRLKVAKTSELIALVESGGKVYQTKRTVKVTVGGCGG